MRSCFQFLRFAIQERHQVFTPFPLRQFKPPFRQGGYGDYPFPGADPDPIPSICIRI